MAADLLTHTHNRAMETTNDTQGAEPQGPRSASGGGFYHANGWRVYCQARTQYGRTCVRPAMVSQTDHDGESAYYCRQHARALAR